MIIYKVCNDFLKGVQEFEVKKLNYKIKLL